MHTHSFSPNFNYYIDTYASLNTPPVNLLKETTKHKTLETLGNNVALRNLLKNIATNPLLLFNFKTEDRFN